MYVDFYDLKQDPFSNTAASEMLFLSGSHQDAIQAIIDGLHAGQEFITLLGETGLGKTFLLHAALAHSDLQHIKTVHVWYPKLSLHDTLKMICREFGLEEVTYDSVKLTHALHRALLTEHERGRQVVLVIDEAHTIPLEILESIIR